MRYFFFIEYRGDNYNGIQKQDNSITIQEVIEKCLKKIFKIDIKITIGSRTDAGVHAYKNCFHLDLNFDINVENIKNALNKMLPNDINILSIYYVIDTAHSRFSAIYREYKYIISNKKSVFDIGCFINNFRDLDIEKMNKVAKYILNGDNNNEKSFKTFSKVNENEKHDYRCIIYKSEWLQYENKIEYIISANRFLHSLIRSLVNAMIYVGLNKISYDEFLKRLYSEDRNNNLGLAPANGLILVNVEYNKDIFIL